MAEAWNLSLCISTQGYTKHEYRAVQLTNVNVEVDLSVSADIIVVKGTFYDLFLSNSL